MNKNTTLLALLTAVLMHFPALGKADLTPQALFSKLESNIDEIPADWASTNPIRVNVCFNLKHPVNSEKANAFLDELYSTIDGFEFDVDINLYRTLYPITFDYCVTMMFPNWEAQREYETSDEFLTFYKTSWKAAVTDTEEHWSVEDLHAGR